MSIIGTTEIRITRRKRHAEGWKVWVRYPWQEQGRNHLVAELDKNKRLHCAMCDNSGCIGVIAIRESLAGRLTTSEET
jgi:hypothetical protein